MVIEAAHGCMSTRGVNQHGSSMVTKCWLGEFKTDAELRRDVMESVRDSRHRICASLRHRKPKENHGCRSSGPITKSFSDLDLAARVAARDADAVRLVTQRNNRRLFRAAWSILKDRDEAEDAVQSAYLRGFGAIASFAGSPRLRPGSRGSSINEALGRLRAAKRRRAHLEDDSVVFLDDYREKLMNGSTGQATPEASVARAQIRQMLEEAIARLPPTVPHGVHPARCRRAERGRGRGDARHPPATVKTRHLRARRRLQDDLAPELKSALTGTFPFAGADCEKLTEGVVAAFCGPRTSPRGERPKSEPP